MPDCAMFEPQDMQQRVLEQNSQRGFSGGVLLVIQWTVGTVLVVLMGSWLVWWTIHLQRQFAEDEIRAACQRVMPDTVQRCVDTVVIQRGGRETMSRGWRRVCTGLLCGAMSIATVSVGAGEELVQESRPKVELSAGTWISVGETKWAHNASSVAGLGNPTSKLTYKDVGTNVIDLAGKFWFSSRVFGRVNVGFADIGGGRLTDDDYGTGQRLFSRTTSNIAGNNMYYINADLGGRVKEFANHRGYLDFFGGYQHLHTEYQAVGIGQVACNPSVIPGQTCSAAGTSSNQGQTVITNTTNWHSLRVGASTEYRLTRRISLLGTAAFIPLSIVENKDIHHLRADLRQNPSISMLGWGVGADADVGLRVMLAKSLAFNVGYRVWWNHAVDGTVTFHGTTATSEYPLTQFDSLRHGLTAGLNFTF